MIQSFITTNNFDNIIAYFSQSNMSKRPLLFILSDILLWLNLVLFYKAMAEQILSVIPFQWFTQVSTCMWTLLTLKASKRWPSWCLRWPQSPCRAAWASSSSSITPGTICSPSSAGIRPDSIRNYGEPIYRRTTTWTGVQKPESGYLYKWTSKLHIQ